MGSNLVAISTAKTSTVDTGSIFKGGKAELKLISSQFKFTEGPAADKRGNIYFTDQPNNRIWKYDVKGKLTVFKEAAGRSNGTYISPDGNLITCADGNNQLWQISPAGAVKVLVPDYKGKHLNGPNDLWINNSGDIYFTDPYYQRDYWAHQQSEMDGEKVYLLRKGTSVPLVITDDLIKPNGIVGTPDGRYLFISDIVAGKIYKYTITPEGTITGKREFYNQGADGITLDAHGNLYLCGNGVTVVSPEGKKIAQIHIPQPWTGNICFGGANKDQLFITASTSIYTIPMNVKGVE